MCLYIFSVKYRQNTRQADDSPFGWDFIKRLQETKEAEKLRLLEAKLAEERQARQDQNPGRGGHGGRRGNRGRQGTNAQRTNSGADVICAWCQQVISLIFFRVLFISISIKNAYNIAFCLHIYSDIYL